MSVSCGDSTAPLLSEVVGIYVLVQVDSSTLPARWFSSDTHVAWVFADTLRLRPDLRATRSTVLEWHTVLPPTASDPQLTQADYTYRLIHRGIELAFVCPPNASCAAGVQTASVTEDGLRITSGQQHLPLVYARVSREP
jgi:hypothetical protein